MPSLPLRPASLAAFTGGAVLAALVAAACGGQVEPDPGSSNRPSQAAPGANAPSSTTRKEPCGRVCDRMITQCAAWPSATPESCTADCTSEHAGEPQVALRYAACIEGLSCEEIRRGMTMDYGPLGECWARAHGR